MTIKTVAVIKGILERIRKVIRTSMSKDVRRCRKQVFTSQGNNIGVRSKVDLCLCPPFHIARPKTIIFKCVQDVVRPDKSASFNIADVFKRVFCLAVLAPPELRMCV